MRIYIHVGILLLLLQFCGCQKEDALEPGNSIKNWLIVEDKPGELNQLRYQLYKNYGISLYVNDTIGSEYRGEDSYGQPIIYYECIRPGYGITTDSYLNYKLSSDTSAMIKATRIMLETVAPRLPENEKYRPYTYLLCDSISISNRSMLFGEYKTIYSVSNSLVTTSVSILDLSAGDELQEKLWAAHVIGKAVFSGIMAFEEELEAFYDITDEGSTSTLYGKGNKSYSGITELPEARLKEIKQKGFLHPGATKYYAKRLESAYPSQAQDVEDFAGVVYVFTEAEITQWYGEYDKIIRKYREMKKGVELFKKQLER